MKRNICFGYRCHLFFLLFFTIFAPVERLTKLYFHEAVQVSEQPDRLARFYNCSHYLLYDCRTDSQFLGLSGIHHYWI